MSDKPRPPYVQFEVRAVEDRTASVDSGHYVAKDVIFAIVTPAGSKDRVEREAADWIKGLEEGVQQERIPMEWLSGYRQALKQFTESNENPENGQSIRDWAAVSPAQAKMLIDLNLRTVEDVAAATEEALQYMGMGARALKAKAIAWLDSANGQGKLAGELDALRTQNADLLARDKAREEEFKILQGQVEALTKAEAAKTTQAK